MRPHIRPQNSVDASLVAALLAEPAEQVGIQPHGHNFFRSGHDDLGGFPELFVRGMSIRIGGDPLPDCGGALTTEPAPVGAGAALGLR